MLVTNMLVSQGTSKYLVYKEIAPKGQVNHLHILAGEKLALTCSDMKIPNTIPFLNCDLVSRKPAGYKFLNVVDRPDGIYVGDVVNPKFEKLSRQTIIERSTPDSAFLIVLNEIFAEKYPDSTFVNKPVIMKFTPNIGSEHIGDYACTIGKMQITESYSCKIWYTKEMSYNWVFTDKFWLVPGTVVRAEYSDGNIYELEKFEDSNFVLQETTESVREALRMFFNR